MYLLACVCASQCVNEDQIKPPSPLPLLAPSPHPPPVPVRGQKGDMENAPTLAGDGLRTGREIVTRGVCVCVRLYMSVYVPSCVHLLWACLYVSTCICVHVYINEHLSLHSLHATPGRQSEEVGSEEDTATSLTPTRGKQ